MEILKDFLSKFLILIIIIVGIIFISGDDSVNLTNNVVDGTELVNKSDNAKIKKGSYIAEPKQQKLSQEKVTITIGGVKVEITKLAKYDITGVVMDTEKYNDVVGPLDVGLAWGNLSKDDNYKNFTSYSVSNRMLRWYSSDSSWMEKLGGEAEIKKCCSNNHLIPINDEIRKNILKIKNDEYIRLTGYLVKAEWKVGNTIHKWGPSSLTRTDEGDNACEIMLVESINFL